MSTPTAINMPSPKAASDQASLSPRKRARLERRIGEALEAVEAGERRVGGSDARARRRAAARMGADAMSGGSISMPISTEFQDGR